MTSDAAAHGLSKLRYEVGQRRVRLKETFQDFDRLRTGYISRDQFSRVLAMANLVPKLLPAEIEALGNQYSHKKAPNAPTQFNYTTFCLDLESPGYDAPVSPQAAGKVAKSLANDKEASLERATEMFVHEVVCRGLVLKTFFHDFDKRNSGKVTASQFHRCFPFRVDPSVMDAIMEKYSDGDDVRYLIWCEDVNKRARADQATQEDPALASTLASTGAAKSSAGGGGGGGGSGLHTDAVITEVRQQVEANRIRIEDSFLDYDKTHSGLLTANQFRSALGRVRFVRFVLAEPMLDALTQRYSVMDPLGVSKVAYGNFLSDIDVPTTVKRFETASARPDRSLSLAVVGNLTEEEEIRAQIVLDKVRNIVHTRRLDMKPVFHDFDKAVKGLYQTRGCTRTRFERTLALVRIVLTPNEMELLERKYECNHVGNLGDVDYGRFCRDVEDRDSVPPQNVAPAASPARSQLGATDVVAASKPLTAQDVVDNIQRVCLDKRIRVAEFLRDFDPLRSLSITKDKFASGLSIAGVTLAPAAVDLLAEAYADANRKGFVRWQKFSDEVDSVFTVKDAVEPTAKSPQKASVLKERADEEAAAVKNIDHSHLSVVIQRLRDTVRARGILLPPFFRDYDTHNRGRITPAQFQQTLARHSFPLSNAEVQLLVSYFSNLRDNGNVNYRDFIAKIDEVEDPVKQLELRRTQGARPVLSDSRPGAATSPTAAATPAASVGGRVDTEATMDKVRACMARRGIRLTEFFRDADPLRCGSVPNGKFSAALNSLGIMLTGAENDALIAYYKSPKAPDAVDYKAFTNDCERSAPKPSEPAVKPRSAMFDKVVARVKQVVDTRRLLLQPMFQDADPLRTGRVTPNQFFSVFDRVQLRLTQAEMDELVAALANGIDMKYVEFCKLVE